MTDEKRKKYQIVCLLDVLGFENLFNKIGLVQIHKKYNELIEIVNDNKYLPTRMMGPGGHVVRYFGEPFQYSYFSDTIMFWKEMGHPIEVQALVVTMNELICRSIEIEMPLRGAISLGEAILKKEEGIYLGAPIISAARAETAQQWIGVTLSGCFWDDEFRGFPLSSEGVIPYKRHIKDGKEDKVFIFVADYAQRWLNSREGSLIEAISKLNVDSRYSSYYENTIDYVKESKKMNEEKWWINFEPPEGWK